MLLKDDETAAKSLLVDAPAIGEVARIEWQMYKKYTTQLKGVVGFILKRAMRISATLSDHQPEPVNRDLVPEDWRKVRDLFLLIICRD